MAASRSSESASEADFELKEHLLGSPDGADERGIPKIASRRQSWPTSVHILVVCLALSLLANVFLTVSHFFTLFPSHSEDVSQFARLARDVALKFNSYSMYGTGNKNESDRSVLWETLDTSPGNIAISKTEAQSMGLPESQDFPWDNSKSIYLLNGHHSMHCLRKVRRWVTIAHHNGTQLDTYAHVVHCMDFLLQDILCEADDTPIYSTHTKRKDAGDGQTRMCRSWDALNEWASAHTACYHFLNETQGVNSTFNRYVYCPHDSPYAQTYRNYLHYPNDWYKERPSEIESMPHYWEQFTDNEFHFHELEDHT